MTPTGARGPGQTLSFVGSASQAQVPEPLRREVPWPDECRRPCVLSTLGDTWGGGAQTPFALRRRAGRVGAQAVGFLSLRCLRSAWPRRSSSCCSG